MTAQDYTHLYIPGNLLHLIYQDAAGAITERVALVVSISADGLALNVICLRRLRFPTADVDTARRRLLMHRVLHARRWTGCPVCDFRGRELVPDLRAYLLHPGAHGHNGCPLGGMALVAEQVMIAADLRWEAVEYRRLALAEAAIGGTR